MVTHDGDSYIASKILGNTGDTTPSWNLPLNPMTEIDTGLETTDGSIVWRAYKRLPNMPSTNFTEWKANKQFGIGDFVYDASIKDYMFKCVDLIKSSGFTAPDLTFAELGDFFVDGNIVWVAKEYSETYDNWASTTNYSLGTSVNVGSSTELSLECVSYTGSTGTEADIDFELPEYPIIEQTSNTFVVAGNKTFYFWEDDVISATHDEGATSFVVSNAVYDGTNTTITVTSDIDENIEYKNLITVERGTRDGQILWKVIEDTNNVTYPWNSYAVFDHTLEIIGD